MKHSKSLFFIISIDTECDKSPDWSVRYPFEFRNTRQGLAQQLLPVFESRGAKPTFLLSPEVIADDQSAELLDSLGSSVELGTHLHGEYVEPSSNFNATYTEDFQSDYLPAIEKAKLTNLTRMFVERFHKKPRSFRAGRFGMSPHTLAFLSELGYAVDSSLYPYTRIVTKRGPQNFYSFPLEPYVSRFNRDGWETVLEVPMTVMSRIYARIPRPLRTPISDSAKADAALRKIFGRERVKTWSLRPSTYDFNQLRAIIEYNVANATGRDVFLNMMFHSNEIIPNCSPYSRNEEDVRRIVATLDQTLHYVKDIGASFIGLADARDLFLNTRRND